MPREAMDSWLRRCLWRSSLHAWGHVTKPLWFRCCLCHPWPQGTCLPALRTPNDRFSSGTVLYHDRWTFKLLLRILEIRCWQGNAPGLIFPWRGKRDLLEQTQNMCQADVNGLPKLINHDWNGLWMPLAKTSNKGFTKVKHLEKSRK